MRLIQCLFYEGEQTQRLYLVLEADTVENIPAAKRYLCRTLEEVFYRFPQTDFIELPSYRVTWNEYSDLENELESNRNPVLKSLLSKMEKW